MSSKYQMVVFHHTAGYIETTSGYSIAYKNKKNHQRSAQNIHSIFTQPVHFPQTDLRHPQQNFADLFCLH